MPASVARNMKRNALGGLYHNGKALSLDIRRDIVERFDRGQKVTSIARDLKLTHGVVSKITRYYVRTKSYLPRSVRSAAVSVESKPVNPFSIDALLSDTKQLVPSSKITDIQMSHLMASFTETPYPTEAEVTRLMTVTGLTFDQIVSWFNNQRNNNSAIVSPFTVSSTSPSNSVPNVSPVLFHSSSAFYPLMPNQSPHVGIPMIDPMILNAWIALNNLLFFK